MSEEARWRRDSAPPLVSALALPLDDANRFWRAVLPAAQPGEIGQHGVGGDHAVSAQVLGGIKGLIGLPEKPVGPNIAAGDQRRHADAERDPRTGAVGAMLDSQIDDGRAEPLDRKSVV